MSRNPDTPCAGGCGKLLWRGRGSRPAGERRCRSCRSAAAQKAQKPGNLPGRHGTAWRTLRARVIAEETHCFRCGGEVDKTLKYPNPLSPSADHIVDIRDGGVPLERENVKLAHFGCNSADGASKRHAAAGNHGGAGKAQQIIQAAGRVAGDDTRAFLLMIRDKLADEMNMAAGAESALIAKELRAVVAALADLNKAAPREESVLDQLAARRAARVADTAG